MPGGRTAVVLTLRADFYPRLARYPALAQYVQARQMLVGGLADDEIRQVIEEPARVAGLEVEAGLVETIRADVVREPGSLPLLQHALLETWRRRQGDMLTLAGYRDTGGVQRGLAERAERRLRRVVGGGAGGRAATCCCASPSRARAPRTPAAGSAWTS